MEKIRFLIDKLFSKVSIDIEENIKNKIIREFFSSYGVNDNEIIAHLDRGQKSIIATFENDDEMGFEIAKIIFRKIATETELKERTIQESKWRYISCGVNKYKENDKYIYNAIHDFRKYMFECNIKLLADVFSLDRIRDLIIDFTDKMNKWFNDKHWGFNYDNLMFEEISTSKEIDTHGIEHPQQNEIL